MFVDFTELIEAQHKADVSLATGTSAVNFKEPPTPALCVTSAVVEHALFEEPPEPRLPVLSEGRVLRSAKSKV